MNNIKYLIVSNTIDFSTDLICLELQNRNEPYLRINRDVFNEYKVIYHLDENKIAIIIEDIEYIIDEDNLKSIFFRAPVFLRSGKSYTVSEQLYRSQWASFIRNLIVFDKCKWINNPVNTYRAENKMYQLKIAKDVGLATPKTLVCNYLEENIEDTTEYIVKSLDTALFFDGNKEMFTYSNTVTGLELRRSNLSTAPVILQEYLKDKIDIRVTVIGDKLFPVKITTKGIGVIGDWRKTPKDILDYQTFVLPIDISRKIITIMKKLQLQFGGVDLIYCNKEYYFIEVNPTGEWGWLKFSTDTNLEVEIVDCMINVD